MDAVQLIDVLSASFFGLIGIWAAVVRRHWFLRFSVVCLFLLLALLLPAYEVVIEFGIQIGLIQAGVWLVRGRKNWRPRVSLETILLLMVVVAVVSAIAAKVPGFSLLKWSGLVGRGVGIAELSLVCLWTVFGKARWWKRILIGLLGVGLFPIVLHFTEGLRYFMQGGDWFYFYEPSYLGAWLMWFVPTAALGVTIFCSVLLLARASGWFTQPQPQTEGPSRPSRFAIASRIALTTIVLLVATPLFYLFYQLLTPTPYPVVAMPQSNAFDDFVTATSTITTDDLDALYQNCESMPIATLKSDLDKLAETFKHIDLGLSREECQIRLYEGQEKVKQAAKAIDDVKIALLIRLEYVRRTGTANERTQEALKILRLGNLLGASRGLGGFGGFWAASSDRKELSHILRTLNAKQCCHIAREMGHLDARRPTLNELVRYQHIADENKDWTIHLQLLLQEWSGQETYERQRRSHRDRVAWTRLLILRFALQSYFLEKNRIPDSLSELVPDYLPAIPDDPFSSEPLQYQKITFGFMVYSVGPNGMDNINPKVIAKPSGASNHDDITAIGPIRSDLLQETGQEGKRLFDKFGF